MALLSGIDLAISQVAHRHNGNIHVDQLHALGVTNQLIRHRAQRGRLYRVFHAVYAVGRPPKLPLEWAAAAVLAGGPTAVLSHRSAAYMWGWVKTWSQPIDITVTDRHRPSALNVHHARLTRDDWRIQLGLRTTSPARTLLDWTLRITDPEELQRAVKTALVSDFLTLGALAAAVLRHPFHRSARRLKPFLDDGAPTQSEFEDAYRAFCLAHDLPLPVTNTHLLGYEIDILYPAHRLIVECDGARWHRDPVSFERDRDRDATMLAHGLATVRITWPRMIGRPRREAERIKKILATRA